jgi:serine/threonine-protein kinase HipA
MKNIFVSPPFDITHTLIYKTIDNKMALKLNGGKEFPNTSDLIRLAQNDQIKIRNPKEIIESVRILLNILNHPMKFSYLMAYVHL